MRKAIVIYVFLVTGDRPNFQKPFIKAIAYMDIELCFAKMYGTTVHHCIDN